ncbi:MAG TPA: SRPBCC domain-containing protein [Flavipsychrobacter sp.]|nr:SRPBCC domain-containing protein [Flavipsychrobacter sp.]
MKTIKKSITINAPKERVWEVLLQDQYTREWYSEFKEGSHAETDWQEGSKVMFLDGEGCGMLGRIVTNKPYELLDVVFDGFVMYGKEDFESEGAKAVKGSHETYWLTENNGSTQLDVASDMGEDWYDGMVEAWDRALIRFKSLAEQKS